MSIPDPFDWPVLKNYTGEYLRRIALPVGGIGTGTISLGGRGDWRDWEIVNRPAKGFSPNQTFFAIRTQSQSDDTFVRALEGPIPVHDYEGAIGSTVPNHGLPRFRDAAFEAAYPFGQVLLHDTNAPVAVRLQAFNPLLAGDADASGFPVVVARFVVHNLTSSTQSTAICGSFENFIGKDGVGGVPKNNVNEFRQGSGYSGLFGRSEGVDSTAPQGGTLALAVLNEDGLEISHRTTWAKRSWGDALLDFWDDFSEDGKIEERDREDQDAPVGSLCAQFEIEPQGTRSVTFLLGWHFPNNTAWATDVHNGGCSGTSGCCDSGPAVIGNYYTTQFADAWDAIEKIVPRLPALEASTLAWVRAFCESDLPAAVKEAALFNLSTLRSTTVFRTPDGKFFGWEGCHDNNGCCHGSCTHVWNYEQATAFLFPDLSSSMRDVEFLYATNDDGLMSFRVNLPLEKNAHEWSLAAADGQMGCLMKLYRDWQLCSDDEWLRRLWPQAKKALAFCWIPGGWDADCDGVMEGCQHNTMDVEYYGPNPQMQGWYLGALRACEEMAKHLSDNEFAAKCRSLFEYGSRWMDENLFNGEYYEHQIRPAENEANIAKGLHHKEMGARDLRHPELQLGAGCLIDQLVGQYFAHVCGLGYLHDAEKVRTTLQSIMRHNFKEGFHDHFNHLRSFVLGDESALLMATYPRGHRPERPFPYYNEVMTGFEYSVAIGMIYEGETDDALQVIEAIRDRYDGQKRSPFDEAECGHHYARALASWAALLALTGFEYSAVTQTMQFKRTEKPTKWFWSTGAAWGTFEQTPREGRIEFVLRVESGVLRLKGLQIGESLFERDASILLGTGQEWNSNSTQKNA
jgi:uncharacterized protein (DUF608 family)